MKLGSSVRAAAEAGVMFVISGKLGLMPNALKQGEVPSTLAIVLCAMRAF